MSPDNIDDLLGSVTYAYPRAVIGFQRALWMDYEVNGCPSGSDSDLVGGLSLGDSQSTGTFSWLFLRAGGR